MTPCRIGVDDKWNVLVSDITSAVFVEEIIVTAGMIVVHLAERVQCRTNTH